MVFGFCLYKAENQPALESFPGRVFLVFGKSDVIFFKTAY